MATLHISRDEALKDLNALITRAGTGDEIVIEEDSGPIAMLTQPLPKPRLLSESLRILEARGSNVTLDNEFGNDLTDVINQHREVLSDPNNDPWA